MSIKDIFSRLRFRVYKEKDEKILEEKNTEKKVFELKNIYDMSYYINMNNIPDTYEYEEINSKNILFHIEINWNVKGLNKIINLFSNGKILSIDINGDMASIDIIIDGFNLQHILALGVYEEDESVNYEPIFQGLKECRTFIRPDYRIGNGSYSDIYVEFDIIKPIQNFNGLYSIIEIDEIKYAVINRDRIPSSISELIVRGLAFIDFEWYIVLKLDVFLEIFKDKLEEISEDGYEEYNPNEVYSIDELIEKFPDDVL